MTLNDRIGGVIMDEKKCWLVVCVQSNREKKTYERLSALGFESFLPLQEETRRWSDRSKKVQRVVIPMVVFARIAPSLCKPLYGIARRKCSGNHPGCTNGTFPLYARLFGRSG